MGLVVSVTAIALAVCTVLALAVYDLQYASGTVIHDASVRAAGLAAFRALPNPADPEYIYDLTEPPPPDSGSSGPWWLPAALAETAVLRLAVNGLRNRLWQTYLQHGWRAMDEFQDVLAWVRQHSDTYDLGWRVGDGEDEMLPTATEWSADDRDDGRARVKARALEEIERFRLMPAHLRRVLRVNTLERFQQAAPTRPYFREWDRDPVGVDGPLVKRALRSGESYAMELAPLRPCSWMWRGICLVAAPSAAL